MRIAVNTRLLLKDKLEGIGWFTYENLKRITKAHPEHQFFFFFDRPFSNEFIFQENIHPLVIPPQARHPILFNLWFDFMVTRALKKYNIDVFLSPDGMLSLKTDVPQIAVMHDLNFEHHPEDLPKHITKYYRKRFPLFAKKAQHILTVSNNSKNDIVKTYGVDANKITVAYNGAGEFYQPLNEEERRKGLNEINNGVPYFVYVGSLHKRKNIERMLLAYKALKEQHELPIDFIIIGDPLWSKDSALDSISEDIHFLGRKSGQELAKIVACSEALVYVSYFEGFGIPVLEGMKSGVPVIASEVSSMPEVGGDAAIYVNPFSVSSIQKGLQKALVKDRFDSYSKLGIEQAKKFSWDKSSAIIWNAIEKVQKRI